MKITFQLRFAVQVALLLASTPLCRAAASIAESARKIPVAYDVDVVVVGGSTRAVAAAVAAKEGGASVFLLAEQPYLGADMCATYRLWLESGELPATPLAKAIFAGGSPTPFHVKRTLDEALLKAKIQFLYGCYPCDVMRDAKGTPAGIVMANRSGRQAVLAKVIIDATDRSAVARLAGAKFAPYPAGQQVFSRIVLGGTPNKEAKLLPIEFTVNSDSRREKGSQTYKVYEYSLKIPMKDGSWDSFAKADQAARDQTWQDGQADASEVLFHIPPDPVKGRATQSGPWPGASAINLDALRPEGLDGIYVLGACADVSREAACQLLRPVNGIDLGMLVGKAAADDIKQGNRGSSGNVSIQAQTGGEAIGVIGEMLNGPRSKPGLEPKAFISSPDRAVPVLGKYDVIVIGGGTGGAPAGIAAARAGAKTLLVEYLDGLGGVGTVGRISNYYHGNKVGFTMEIDAAMATGSSKMKSSGCYIEKKMDWYRKEIVKAGGAIWFHTLACGSVLADKRFVGVVVATPEGRGVVLANTVIDATGNAVIPACAGIPCQEIGAETISVQGAGLPTFSPGVGYLNGDWAFNDDDDVMDMWRMFVVGKQKVSKDKADYQNPFDMGQMITTRARRRIIGDLVITPMDIINQRTYPDTITVAKSNFDNHGFSSHDIFMITGPDSAGLTGKIPYRALMPKGYDGLLATGLGISAHGDAMPVLRMQPDVQNQGYAAGYAAALAAQGGRTVRTIDVKQLQKHLVEKGIIPNSVMEEKDSYPISDDAMKEAVGQIGRDYKGIALILADVTRALPLLQDAWRKSGGEAKLRYAHVLGMLGDATGTESLIEKLTGAVWDKGWNFRGMGQYGPTTSYIDNLVIALGRTRDKRGLDVTLQLLGKLTSKSEFSHCRAVAMALESLRDKRAAKPLAEFLGQVGMTGHGFAGIEEAIGRTPPSFSDTTTRNNSLRELVLARALYRCGDHNGFGKTILNNYANDLCGHYATHAKAILKESAQSGN